MRKNRPYPLYDLLPEIGSLHEMMAVKLRGQAKDVAFAYFDRKGNCYNKTYLEFCAEVRSVSEWIASRKAASRHIGILGENSYDWLVMFMAVICSGNAAVALDKDMTQEELLQAAGDADVGLILHSAKAGKKITKIKKALEAPGKMPDCCSFDEAYAAASAPAPEDSAVLEYFDKMTVDADAMCCMFFTSGTGGRRKPVMLSHRNIASDINGSCQLFVLEGDTYTVLPFHHAFGLIVGVWMVFHYGHTVYISSGLRYIPAELKAARPQTMMLVPLFVESFYKQIRQEAAKAGRQKQMKAAMLLSDLLRTCGIDIRRRLFKDVLVRFGGNLEYIICGGAPLDKLYVEKFRKLGIEILNGYGTTECSPVAAVNRNHYRRDGSVGLALPGSEVVISQDGEVLVRGPHVMLGYYDNAKKTENHGDSDTNWPDTGGEEAEKIDENGFYHTGDLGRIDRDGFIFLTGRKKNLIILSNGENVSPEELEEKLLRFDSINEVIVSADDGVICAEIYPETNDSEENLYTQIQNEIDSLNKQLPAYKQITRTVFRNTPFEKTTTKKIRR